VTVDKTEQALAALHRGQVVAAATETFFGLLADARQSAAIDRVLWLKGRDAAKGISLLLPTRESWGSVVIGIPELAQRLAERFWPGPLTIVLPARPDLDSRLTVDGKVAARWPGESVAASLTSAFGAPVTATSANLSGQPPCSMHEDVERAFSGEKDLVIVGGRAPGGSPSTLVEIDGNRIRIVRQGAVSREQLAAVVPGSALS
jgi:L-threonylcarbamoyladenylate synthase